MRRIGFRILATSLAPFERIAAHDAAVRVRFPTAPPTFIPYGDSHLWNPLADERLGSGLSSGVVTAERISSPGLTVPGEPVSRA